MSDHKEHVERECCDCVDCPGCGECLNNRHCEQEFCKALAKYIDAWKNAWSLSFKQARAIRADLIHKASGAISGEIDLRDALNQSADDIPDPRGDADVMIAWCAERYAPKYPALVPAMQRAA